jgi:ankyrin repeat protein
MSSKEKNKILSLVTQTKTSKDLIELDKLKNLELAYEPATYSPNKVFAVLLGLCKNAFQRRDKTSYNNIHNYLNENFNNHNLLTEAANYEDKFERTCLHIIVGAKAPLTLVEQIIDLAPGSLTVQDEEGRLPLHYASKYGASPNVINLLVDSFPESINIKDNTDNCPIKYALTTQSRDLLRGAYLPEPLETKPKDRKKIYIANKTSRRLKVEFREAFPRIIPQGGGITLFGSGFHGAIAQVIDPTVGCAGVYVVEEDEVKAFPVRDCEGLYFDFLCYANESYGRAINHPVQKGYTQEIRGQPFRVR